MKKEVSVEELYKRGQIKKWQFFYKRHKRKILKNSIYAKRKKYRTYYEYEVYRFRGIAEDGRYDFDLFAEFREDKIISRTGMCSMGKDCVFDLKPLKNVKFW